ncbi:polyubiquitin-like [Belonocnema kinseyi]|uniref:polyubiquitin-like n=1 Tax=Belonocnema kinseyi TaxID=2817044 RepID=UPI00143D242A|nr:polyubiquitin-like [Belonocnema kinseyi]
MKIFINILTVPNNGNYGFECEPSNTIQILKKKIESELKIPDYFQRLLYTGDILNEERTISSYKIRENSVLNLDLRFRDDLKIKVKAKNGSTATFELQTQTLIEDIKFKLKGKEGFSSNLENFALFFSGRELEGRKSLSFYKIADGSTLFLDFLDQKMKRISIKTNSKTIRMDYNPADKVSTIKSEIERLEGIPIFLQRLKFNNEEMNNHNSLESYQIKIDSCLQLDLCYQEMQIMIQNRTGKIRNFDVKASDTIQEIKAKIQEKDGFNPKHQYLLFEGEELENEKSLSDYNIRTKSTLHLVLTSDANLDEQMQIFVRTMDGRSIICDVEPSDTIENLKIRIQEKEGVSQYQQHLIFKGKAMEDDKSLLACNIEKDSTLYLILCLPKKKEIFVQNASGSTINLEVNPADTIEDVKAKISEKEGILICHQRLIYGSKLLVNNKTIIEYGICERATLRLGLRSC